MNSGTQRGQRILSPSFFFMAGLTLVAALVVFILEGFQGVWVGFLSGMETLRLAGVPFLLGMSLAGLIPILLSDQMVNRWMGEGTGLKGMLFGSFAGLLTPGGPYVMFPIAASLIKSGAGMGSMAAYSAARQLVPINRIIVWEIPLIGATFPIIRSLVSVPTVVFAALLVPLLFELISKWNSKQTK